MLAFCDGGAGQAVSLTAANAQAFIVGGRQAAAGPPLRTGGTSSSERRCLGHVAFRAAQNQRDRSQDLGALAESGGDDPR